MTQSITELAQKEKLLVDAIIAGIKSQQIVWDNQMHRYPSTSGIDVHHSRVLIDDSLGDDVISSARGNAIEANADYDGDKEWTRDALIAGEYKNIGEFQKAAAAARRLREVEDRIADDLAKWEAEENGTKNVYNEKDIDALINDLANRQPNRYAALMSKLNKKYVGQFSNMSTHIRNSLTDLGMDEISGNGGTEMAARGSFLRAFFEMLEQDSISAKKVFGRLSSSKGSTQAADELEVLYNQLYSGEWDEAVNKAQELDIIKQDFLNSRQF